MPVGRWHPTNPGTRPRSVKYVWNVPSPHSSSHPVRFVCLLLILLGWQGAHALSPRVARFGPGVVLHGLHRLSDGSLLAAGWARDLSWIPGGTIVHSLPAPQVDSRDTTGRAILLRWSANLDTMLWVAAFPPATLGPLRHLRSPGSLASPQDILYLSGDRTVSDPLRDGYFIARLSGDLVRGDPPGVTWTHDVLCPPRRAGGRRGISQYKLQQAWDVDGARVWLARGAEADYDSAEVVRLDASTGRLSLVAEWRDHPTRSGKVWRGQPAAFLNGAASQNDSLLYSRLSLRSTASHAPRSVVRVMVSGTGSSVLDADSSGVWARDGAGQPRRGGQPLDILFPGPCREFFHDPALVFPDSVRCPAGRGWSGLAASSRATPRIGGLVVERGNTGRWFLGVTWSALAPDGSPVDVPVVMAFESEGRPLWWSRLRGDALDSASPAPSPGLAEIQALAIGGDEARDGPAVLVAGRARQSGAFWPPTLAGKGGWRGALSEFSDPGASATWLGVLTRVSGEFFAGTWVASPTATSGGARLSESIYSSWPVPGSTGEILAGTECPTLMPGASGRLFTACVGERPLVTADAWRAIPAPGTEGPNGWNVFTTWDPGLTAPLWSTAFDGVRSTGDSGVGVALDAVIPLLDGSLIVAAHPRRASLQLEPVGSPAWSDARGDALLALLPPAARVETRGRALRQGGPVLRSTVAGLQVVLPGAGALECRWLDPSGKELGNHRSETDRMHLPVPAGKGMVFLRVRSGDEVWTLPFPVVR